MPKVWALFFLNRAVEERSNWAEAGKVIDGGLIGSENPDMSNDKHG
jgi:hypothetical protein